MGRTVVAALLLLVGCGGDGNDSTKKAPNAQDSAGPESAPAPPKPPAGEYVGTTQCTSCHASQHGAWTGSDHDRAMQEPTESTVLGAFDGSELTQGPETFRFSKSDGGYAVEVRTGEGESKTYPVRYTFGADPLQQYLVDVGNGRLQALLVAWDARARDDGGQRWFHLQSDEYAPPGDPLHWLAPVYTWNTSCADCHSTNVAKGYDRAAGAFETTYTDVDVGCEACHGPGSVHVETAKAGRPTSMPYPLVKPDSRAWVRAPGEPIAKLQGGSEVDPELDRCAPCHSRRAELQPSDEWFNDGYRLSLLDDGLYFADGQIQDEVFVYGSFLQSKMHAQGVVCSDCHDPHSGQLRARGNAMCSMCHGQEVFDTTQHHLHPSGSEGAQCVACHMPQRTYMQLDARADHRFGVPDPLLSASAGSPDPCLSCHKDWTPQRAADEIAKGRKKPRKLPYGVALLAARQGDPKAPALLSAVISDPEQPAIVRATALRELGQFPSPALATHAQNASGDPNPLLRREAAELAATFPSPLREQIALPLLSDPVRSVRIEATATMLTSDTAFKGGVAQTFDKGRKEYAAVHEAGSDRAQGLVNLANLARFEDDLPRAQELLEAATKAEPALVTAHVNLADLHRLAGRESEAEKTLRAALGSVADPGPIRHALGLSLIRAKRTEEALRELEAAHRARPDIARYGFVYGVALFDAGQKDKAFETLQGVHERHRGDLEVVGALAQYATQLGRTADAQRYRAVLQQSTAASR